MPVINPKPIQYLRKINPFFKEVRLNLVQTYGIEYDSQRPRCKETQVFGRLSRA